ncbi:MAG: superoxide dismutase family protein [Candidatus Binatia bacterium]
MQRAARWTVAVVAAIGRWRRRRSRRSRTRDVFVNAQGKEVGTLTVEHMPSGTMFLLKARPARRRARRAHPRRGTCTPPSFDSAGPHWNPAGAQHGKDNPKGKHGGDLDNLTIPANGKLEPQVVLPGTALRGAGGLLDEDGASIVIHANPDDYKTDPSGNLGARIACALIEIDDRQD